MANQLSDAARYQCLHCLVCCSSRLNRLTQMLEVRGQVDFLHREHWNALPCLCQQFPSLEGTQVQCRPPTLARERLANTHFRSVYSHRMYIWGKKSSSSKSANKKLNYYMQLDHHTTLVDLTIACQQAMCHLTDTKNSLSTPIDPHNSILTGHTLTLTHCPHSSILSTPIDSHISTLTGHTHPPHSQLHTLATPRDPSLTHWPHSSTHTHLPHT